MLDKITPILLSYNEAPNIARSLEKLRWAREVVLVDSLSTDRTLEIARRFPNVRVFERRFTGLADQWNFAISETGIGTEWIFTLAPDCLVTDELVQELATQVPSPDVVAYKVNFTYCIYGRPLRGSVYPADYKVFRLAGLSFVQDGHTERAVCHGRKLDLRGHVLHDDHKPLSRWLWSQDRYEAEEARKLIGAVPAELDITDRIRRHKFFAPFLVLLYCLFAKRLILEGKAGMYYAFQRMTAELILSLNLLDAELTRSLPAAAEDKIRS